MRVGLLGFGKAGQAVAHVLQEDERFDLRWIARRHTGADDEAALGPTPVIGLDRTPLAELMQREPVDALVDFSHHSAVWDYAELVRQHRPLLVTAISAYDDAALDCLRSLGEVTRVMASPNITIGINFLMLAARLLRQIAPFADVAILEQHFRNKPEVSGTARKIADTLEVEEADITSMRLGGIVGHHEVIFGFPHQTVRLIHSSIRREAFGTGAAFALIELAQQPAGFYSYEDLMLRRARQALLHDGAPGAQGGQDSGAAMPG